MTPRARAHAVMVVATVTFLFAAAGARQSGPGRPVGAGTPPPGEPPSRAVSMEELHRIGGVPRGWKFTLPAGDVARGRRVFVELECFRCHAVAGERFPAARSDSRQDAGPELTGMGGLHPAEYFAESVLIPDTVIVKGPGYTGPDGRSIMPSYTDSLSVAQLVDLVAYLRSLTAGGPHGDAGHGPDVSH